MFSGVWFNNSIHPYSGFRFRLPGFLHQIFIRSCKPLSLSLFFYLFLLPSAFLFYHFLFPCFLGFFLIFIHSFLPNRVWLFFSIYLSSYLSFYPFIYLSSTFHSTYLFIFISIYLSIYLSLYLSIFPLIVNQLQCTVRCPTELTLHQ